MSNRWEVYVNDGNGRDALCCEVVGADIVEAVCQAKHAWVAIRPSRRLYHEAFVSKVQQIGRA